MSLPKVQTLINASTISVTDPVSANGSNTYDVSEADKISLEFTAASISSGNGVFKVYVSNDGTNWVLYARLLENATVADGHNPALVSSSTLSANGSKFYFFPMGDSFRYIGVSLTITTDGAYSAKLYMSDTVPG